MYLVSQKSLVLHGITSQQTTASLRSLVTTAVCYVLLLSKSTTIK